MKNYIVRNCPAIYINHNNEYDYDKADYFCQDCTDCVLKRIVKLCKDEEFEFANEILNMLEIEEVDEQIQI